MEYEQLGGETPTFQKITLKKNNDGAMLHYENNKTEILKELTEDDLNNILGNIKRNSELAFPEVLIQKMSYTNKRPSFKNCEKFTRMDFKNIVSEFKEFSNSTVRTKANIFNKTTKKKGKKNQTEKKRKPPKKGPKKREKKRRKK